MKKQILSILLLCCMVLTLLPTYAAATETENTEQFNLKPADEYYYFYIEEWGSYVRFNYAGTVDAYVLNSRSRGKTGAAEEASENTQNTGTWFGHTYTHSLFIARNTYLKGTSWDALNGQGLIFGKTYESNGVKYTMRAPTVGSNYRELEEGWKVTPANNEWDAMLNKGTNIRNADYYSSWGQDTTEYDNSYRAVRGGKTKENRGAQIWGMYESDETKAAGLYYRPVLEVMNAEELGKDGLKVVTLDMNWGNLLPSSVQRPKIIVRGGTATFKAPTATGIKRPRGNTGSYFKWLGDDGALYEPGAEVPATVTELKAQWNVPEQFSLEPGETYYFDLSKKGLYTANQIRTGKVYKNLPDKTLHYVPFTYAGTVGAYRTVKDSENKEHSGNDPHTLFVSESITRWGVSWHTLNGEGLIFGKTYESNGVGYAMRAPTGGNGARGNNEWDRILDKNETYIKGSFGRGNWCQEQDRLLNTLRGADGNGVRAFREGMGSHIFYNYRPVLEVMNAKALGQDSLKAVTLQLNGGTVDGKTQIQIIVKNGETFTAPVLDGIGKPGDYTEGYFQWLGNDGQLYAPGDSVPATVDTLMAQFAPAITTDTLPGGKVDEAYRQTLTANGTTPIIWSIENGGLPAGLSLNKDTGEISGTPTADGTAKFTVKAENRVGSDMKELSITIDKAEPPSHAHSYSDWIADGETGHYRICTDEYCTSADKGRVAEAHLYDDDADTICDVCGYERTVTPPVHEHTYSNWTADGETGHYRICTDEYCTSADKGRVAEAHLYDDDADMICNACGYDRTVTPPSHEHNYGNWSRDDTSHWHECTDADCPDRNESIKDKAAHIYTVYTDDADTTAAEFSDGSDVAAAYVCDVCGYERIVTPPSHEHSYDDWSKDGTSHWHECTDDGCPEKPESVKDKAAHVYTDDADSTCDVFGYERTVTPPVHEHTYSDWTADGETGHYRVCTDEYCTSADKGRVTEAHLYDDDADMICNACGYERTATPPSHEHSYGDWSKDDTNHWHECTDNSCPDRDESIKDKAAHVYSVYTDNAAATCNICGYEHTGTPPVHEHTYSDWTADGETGHYRVCTDENCTSADKGRVTEAHVYTDDADTTAAEFSDGSDVAVAHIYTDDADMSCHVCGYKRTGTPPAPTEFTITSDSNGGYNPPATP